MAKLKVPNKIEPNTEITAEEHQENYEEIETVVNNLDGENIADLSLIGGLTAGVVRSSEGLTLTSESKDIPGSKLEITPKVASKLLVVAFFDFQHSEFTQQDGLAQGTLRVDGKDESTTALFGYGESKSGGNSERATVGQGYVVSLSAEAHTLLLRARKVSGDMAANASHTGYLYALFAS